MKSLTLLLAFSLTIGNTFSQDAKPSTETKEAPPAKQNLAIVPTLHKGTEGRINKFNEISKKGEAELVFLGDSITQGWEGAGKATWDKHYANRKAANFGISGDKTEDVLWRLDNGNFDGLKPKLIVIMIGTNNTGHRFNKPTQDTPEETTEGVKAIIARLQKKCPDAKILLLAIFPRGEKAADPMRVHNEKINALLEKLADNKMVFWQNINAKFLTDDGTLTKEIMPDRLHPQGKGYEIWAEAIEENIAKLLGEKKE